MHDSNLKIVFQEFSQEEDWLEFLTQESTMKLDYKQEFDMVRLPTANGGNSSGKSKIIKYKLTLL